MADSKVKKIESKRVKAILFDEDGRVLHTFGDAWANWATAEKTPALGIYFDHLGSRMQITIPIEEIRRTLPPKKITKSRS